MPKGSQGKQDNHGETSEIQEKLSAQVRVIGRTTLRSSAHLETSSETSILQVHLGYLGIYASKKKKNDLRSLQGPGAWGTLGSGVLRPWIAGEL